MSKKNTINLSFDYTMWSVCVDEDQMTKSVSKMKKIVADDIKKALTWGYKKHGEHESELELSIPFFRQLSTTRDMKVKVEFDEDCVFKCEKLSGCLKTRNEYGEIGVDGKINVIVTWKI